jgi:hypothetical protein
LRNDFGSEIRRTVCPDRLDCLVATLFLSTATPAGAQSAVTQDLR